LKDKTVTRQNERLFIFVFRIFAGWLFFYAAWSDELLLPTWTETHFLQVIRKTVVFHSWFMMLAAPNVTPLAANLIMYGHLLLGLSLLSGLMVRVSACFGILAMVLYWIAGIRFPDLVVLNHTSLKVPLVLLYRLVMNIGGTVFDLHILWSVILVYLIVARAGHVWGLDAWAVKTFPFLKRLRVCD
jgi:thiosulfate dehydrogenase [quinone] large subunit